MGGGAHPSELVYARSSGVSQSSSAAITPSFVAPLLTASKSTLPGPPFDLKLSPIFFKNGGACTFDGGS